MPSELIFCIISTRIELLGGRRAGTFKFEAKMYVTKPPQSSKKPIAPPTVEEGKMVFVVTSMLLPSSTARPILNPTCVAIGDIVLACEQPEFGLIDKLRNMYHFRKCAKVEGPYFELGDFILKTGSLFVNNGVKCALLEVQYPPCPMLPLCQELFKELLLNIVPNVQNVQVVGPLKPILPPLQPLTTTILETPQSPSSKKKIVSGHRKVTKTNSKRTNATPTPPLQKNNSNSQLFSLLSEGADPSSAYVDYSSSVPFYDIDFSLLHLPSTFSIRHTVAQYLTIMRVRVF
eukprot:Sdes_comp20729_c0_seq1m16531